MCVLLYGRVILEHPKLNVEVRELLPESKPEWNEQIVLKNKHLAATLANVRKILSPFLEEDQFEEILKPLIDIGRLLVNAFHEGSIICRAPRHRY